jgi:hypothetical protein
MKTKIKILLIGIILLSALVVVPSTISIISPIYCNSIYPEYCEVYSISLIGFGIPNFFADNTSIGAPTVVDPRIEQVTDGFEISADLGVFNVDVIDERQAILLSIKSGVDGFISMDDPMPILQGLFPEKKINSLDVFDENGKDIWYTRENGKWDFL